MDTIGERIRAIRRAQNMSQKTLAKAMGLSDATINRYEANTVNIPLDNIEKIAKILGVPITDLIQSKPPRTTGVWKVVSKSNTLADKLKDAIDIMSDSEQRELSSYVLMILSARDPESSLDKFIGALDNSV